MTVDMKKLEALLARQPHIPAGKQRGVEVVARTLPAGSKVPIVSIRNAILMGQKYTTGILDKPYRKVSLEYKGGVWMTNAVQEIWQMREPLEFRYLRMIQSRSSWPTISAASTLLPLP